MRIGLVFASLFGAATALCGVAAAQDGAGPSASGSELSCQDLVGPLISDPDVAFEGFQPDVAISTCQAEFADHPDDAARQAYLAMALAEAGRWEEMAESALASAETGNPIGQWFMGRINEGGYGREIDLEEAATWYRAAADQGYPQAQFDLGWLYDDGRGVALDDAEALRLYRAAADQGHLMAQNFTGAMYETGEGVEQNYEEARRWYQTAAEAGLAQAQRNLGRIYDDGLGVPEDDELAARWFRSAAEQGDSGAQFNLAWMFDNGFGVPEDDEAGNRWYLAAAEQDHVQAQFNLAWNYDNGHGVPENDVEAVRWYRAAADGGHISAQNALGTMYQDGRGVEQSDEEAVRWYRLAAENGLERGQYNLGWMYDNGRGVPEDKAEAARWYRAAAEQGFADAQFNLAWLLDHGDGVPLDDTEAARWYREAAEQGYASAQTNLGIMYENGEGVEQSDDEAVRWYRAAAEQGNARGQFNLGWMYDNGRGVPENDQEAVRWYQQAAEQEHAQAQFNLGWMYDNGHGVPQDDDLAVRWYRVAAEQGHVSAQTNLGVMYEYGEGVEPSDEAALGWYRKAADQGSAQAQFNLGWMYDNGRGVPEDDGEAFKWYRAAAEQGHASAQTNLGVMFKNGEGVEASDAEALRWYRAAAEQGNSQARLNLGWAYVRGNGVEPDLAIGTRWLIEADAFDAVAEVLTTSDEASRLTALPDSIVVDLLNNSFEFENQQLLAIISHWADRDRVAATRLWQSFVSETRGLDYYLAIRYQLDLDVIVGLDPLLTARAQEGDLWASLLKAELPARDLNAIAEVADAARDGNAEIYWTAWARLLEYLGEAIAAGGNPADELGPDRRGPEATALAAWNGLLTADDERLPSVRDQFSSILERSPIAALGMSLSEFRLDPDNTDEAYRYFERALRPDVENVLEPVFYMLDLTDTLDGLDYFLAMADVGLGRTIESGDQPDALDILLRQLSRTASDRVPDRLAAVLNRNFLLAVSRERDDMAAAIAETALEIAEVCVDAQDVLCLDADRGQADRTLYLAPANSVPAGLEARTCPETATPKVRYVAIGDTDGESMAYIANDISLMLNAAGALGAEPDPLRLVDRPAADVFRTLREVVADTPCGTTVWLHLSGPGATWPYGMVLADADLDVVNDHHVELASQSADDPLSAVSGEAPLVHVENTAVSRLLSPREIGAFVDALRLRSNNVVVSVDVDEAGAMDIGQWIADGAQLEVVDFGLGTSNWTVHLGRQQEVEVDAETEAGEPRLGDATIIIATNPREVEIADCGRPDSPEGQERCMPRTYSAMTFALARAMLEKSVSDPESLSKALEEFELDVGDHEIEFISTNPAMRIAPGQASSKETLEVEINGLETVDRGSRGALRLVTDEPVYHLAGRIKDLTLPDVLLIDGKAVTLGSDGRFSHEIPLADINHALRIVAVFPDSSVRLRTLSISYTGDPNNLLSRGDYYALLIGNTDYQNDDIWQDLDTPDDDVREVAETLKNGFGFKTEIAVAGKTVSLVLYNATKPEILQRLSLLRKVLTERDRLLVYYAGHGYIDSERDDRAFWIPVEGSGDILEDYTWLNSREVKDQVAKIPAKHILIVADSCFSGGFARSGNPEEDARLRAENERLREKYLSEMAANASRMILSSGDLELVSDGTGAGHSPFAEAFLDGLNSIEHTAFAGSDLFYSQIKERVTGTSNQRPQYVPLSDSGHQGGDFVFQRAGG